jgi:hypothetical protein
MRTELVTITPDLEAQLAGASLTDFVYSLAGLPLPAAKLSLSYGVLGLPCYVWQDGVGNKFVAAIPVHSSLRAVAKTGQEAVALAELMTAQLLNGRALSRQELRTAELITSSEAALLSNPTKANCLAWLRAVSSSGLNKQQTDALWLLAVAAMLQADLVPQHSKAFQQLQLDACQYGCAWEQQVLSDAAKFTEQFTKGLHEDSAN